MAGAPQEAQDPLVGRIIDGRYQIASRLGEGGLGAVYRATQTRLGRPVAVKVLHAEHASTKSLRERFEREARSLGTLVHPNIVQVIDYGIEEDAPFLVMELLEGRPLNEAIRAGIGLERAFEIGRAITSAVAYAHARRVVHRDLKPANVFLQRTPDGGEIPRVLDFGLAKFLDGDQGEGAALTKVGTILGTPSYMSPEQASGAPTDARADVYSLGIVLFELFAGVRPFRGTPEELLRMHLFTDTPTLESARPGIPHTEKLDAVLRRATEKAARDRYADAGELLAALDALPPLGSVDPKPKLPPRPAPAADFTFDATMVATPAASGPAQVPATVAVSSNATEPTAVPASANAPLPATSAVAAPRVPEATATPAPAPPQRISKPLLLGGAAVLAVAVIGVAVALAPGGDEAPEDATVEAASGGASPTPGASVVTTNTTAGEAEGAGSALDTAAPLPPELEEIRSGIRPGGRIGFMDRRRLNRWSRANPGDPRAWLLVAHADFQNGARTDALTWYENAVDANRHAVDDPVLRRDLVIMAGHGTVGSRARAMVLDYFGADAGAEIDAALREERLDDNEQRRLREFRATLR